MLSERFAVSRICSVLSSQEINPSEPLHLNCDFSSLSVTVAPALSAHLIILSLSPISCNVTFWSSSTKNTEKLLALMISFIWFSPIFLNRPDLAHRDKILAYVRNEHTIAFWQNEFLKYSPTLRAEAISPILNKTGLFLTSIPLRNVVGQKTRSFRMQQVLDGSKILICNFSKGMIGEDACALLGSMLVTSIQLSALYRAKQPEHTRKPFFLFIDEFQTFVTLSFADMLAEARKYGLGVFMANQFLDQLHEKIRASIFGNVGTLISFRLGATDAELLEKEFYPVFEAIDLVNLPRYSMYLKLMIDGASGMPFSANSLAD